jgi:hypothetical protein
MLSFINNILSQMNPVLHCVRADLLEQLPASMFRIKIGMKGKYWKTKI